MVEARSAAWSAFEQVQDHLIAAEEKGIYFDDKTTNALHLFETLRQA